jgi:hypothetical protein
MTAHEELFEAINRATVFAGSLKLTMRASRAKSLTDCSVRDILDWLMGKTRDEFDYSQLIVTWSAILTCSLYLCFLPR